MTVYSMTMTNSLRVFGNGPSSLWNAYNWNVFKWGEDTAKIPDNLVKLINTEPLSLNSARYYRLTKLLTNQSLVFDSSRGGYVLAKVISNDLSTTTNPAHLYLVDGNGYYHDFPGSTTDARSRVESTWSDGTSTSPTWVSGTASSTSWS